MSILIKGGRVITAADDYVADVFVEDERISLIGESLDQPADKLLAKQNLDVNGLKWHKSVVTVTPGGK